MEVFDKREKAAEEQEYVHFLELHLYEFITAVVAQHLECSIAG